MGAEHSVVRLLLKIGALSEEPKEISYLGRPELPIRILAKGNSAIEMELMKRLSEYLNVPIYDPHEAASKKRIETASFKSHLDYQLCWRKKVVPLWEEDGRIRVAMANPVDQETLQELCFPFAKNGLISIARERDVMGILREHLPPSRIQFDTIQNVGEAGEELSLIEATDHPAQMCHYQADLTPIIKICNRLIADATRKGASDIHFHPTAQGMDVKFRIDGVMHLAAEIDADLKPALTSRVKLLAGMDIADHRTPQDGRFGVKIDGDSIDIRTSCVPTTYGSTLVLRLLRNDVSELHFSSLGFSDDQEQTLKAILASRGRMLLVTGPTGSGKTTTLYTCLNALRDGTINIETVEDPIEYRVSGVQQIQVNESAGITFASALRSILRQDPDVIMIGEIRDEETAKIALQAAQTGHLVLSTLHTNDAVSTITRLIDLGVPPFMVASSVAGVLSQRLVRRICSRCRTKAGEDYLNEHGARIAHYHLSPEGLFVGAGCQECLYTGYKGRTAVYSYLHITDQIARSIHDGKGPDVILDIAKRQGFSSLEQSALQRVQGGVTTLSEVIPLLPSLFISESSAQREKSSPQGLTYFSEIDSPIDSQEQYEIDWGVESPDSGTSQ